LLTLAYVALCVIGCGYILASVMLGHGADTVEPGHGGDVAHAEFHFPLFSPLALATLFASMGAWGLIGRYGLGLNDGRSLALAIPAALITAYLVTMVAFKVIQGSKGTSTIKNADLIGAQAEVITPIPAGGIGEVAAMVSGQRFTSPAREANGGAVARGAFVTVRQAVGSTLVVAAGPGPQGGS
jgi:membrane-bound ClpP family serine protease